MSLYCVDRCGDKLFWHLAWTGTRTDPVGVEEINSDELGLDVIVNWAGDETLAR